VASSFVPIPSTNEQKKKKKKKKKKEKKNESTQNIMIPITVESVQACIGSLC
jgi:hypothetical protein